MERRVVVNATSIGSRLGGIGVYGLNLVRALTRVESDLSFTIVLNESARPHFLDLAWPPRIAVRWVADSLSPDRGSLGHLRRWIYAHRLGLEQRSSLVFATSQIEAALIGGPRVVMVHDLIPLRFREGHPRQYPFFRRLLRPALRGTAAVVVPSRATRDRLREHYALEEERIRVIPHGVSVPLREPAPVGPRRESLVLCFGGSSHVKNVATVMRAFGLVEGRIPHRLVVVGAHSSRAPLDTGAAGRAVARVQWLDWVSEREKLELLDRAAVLVCASLDEGFGFPALEAMARGCPVLASWAGSLPEVCGDAAVYVKPRDAEGIAAALLALVDTGPLRQTLVDRGLRRAAAFDWDASAAAHVRLFREVLASGAGGREAERPPAALGGEPPLDAAVQSGQ